MKKGLLIVGECLLLIFIMVVIKNVLSNHIPGIENSDVLSFVLYVIYGIGCVFVYRFHTGKKQ